MPLLILILGALFMLGICIVVHELGHLLCGKLVGVRARIFSLGYGKGVWKKRIGKTIYQITAIPLGGYVMFFGDSYYKKMRGKPGELLSTPPIKRIIPIIGGSLFNFIMGFLIIFMLSLVGDRSPGNRVFIDESTNEISPAFQAGLRTGDRILSINGKITETFEDIYIAIGLSAGDKLELKYETNGIQKTIQIQPEVFKAGGRPTIGIEPFGDRKVVATFTYSEQIRYGLTKLFDSGEKSDQYFKKLEKGFGGDEEKFQEYLLLKKEKEAENALKSRAIVFLNDGDVIIDVEGEPIYSVPQLQKVLGKYPTGTIKLKVERKKYPLLNPWSSEVVNVSASVRNAFLIDFNSIKDQEFPELSPGGFSLSSYDPKIGTQLGNLSVNGKRFEDPVVLRKYLESLDLDAIVLTVGSIRYTAKFSVKSIGLLGFRPSMKLEAEYTLKKESIPEAFLTSWKKVYKHIETTFTGIGMMFSGLISPKDNLSGPIGIVQYAGMSLEYGWYTYLDFIARISIALMIMNLLPIPLADGGHIVLCLYEAVVGRRVPINILENIFRLGFLFLLLLGIFVSFYDIMRFF